MFASPVVDACDTAQYQAIAAVRRALKATCQASRQVILEAWKKDLSVIRPNQHSYIFGTEHHHDTMRRLIQLLNGLIE